MKYAVLGFLALGIVIVGWRTFGPDKAGTVAVTPATVVTPDLSAAALMGKKGFDDNCAACHGANATGTDVGPPLIHTYYNPGHHGDGAFQVAVAQGVRQHHWNFGNMPRQPQVSRDQARMIIRYVREMQAANGIGYKPH